MKYKDGLPADNGATDFMDSARLAGLMVLFDHPNMNPALISKYMVQDSDGNLVGVRHPVEYPANNPKNFTRDQTLPLAAGLSKAGYVGLAQALYQGAQKRNYRAQNTEADVPGSVKLFPNGADIFSPSNMNHLRVCAGKSPSILGRLWLILDIVFNSIFARLDEPNQLMCQCKVAGPFYVKLLRRLNGKLDQAIREYWSGWRGESEFAEFLVEKFK